MLGMAARGCVNRSLLLPSGGITTRETESEIITAHECIQNMNTNFG